MLNNLKIAISAEYIKYKNSGFQYIIFAFAIIVPALFVFAFIFGDLFESNIGFPYHYYTQGVGELVKAFSSMFLLLFIVICAVRINQIDHKNNAWRLMETQPLTKLSIYVSKFFWLMASIAFVIILFTIIGILEFWVYSWFIELPEIASTQLEVWKFLAFMFRLWVSTFSFAALVFVISILFSNSLTSLAIGFGLMLIKFIATAFVQIPLRAFPISFITKIDKVENPSELGHFLTYDIYVGLFMALIILYLGYLYFKHKNFYYAFVRNKFRGGTAFSVVILSSVLIWFFMQPKTMHAFDKTVISGKIDSEVPINSLLLSDGFNNKIAQIPVTNNEFRIELQKGLPLDNYFLIMGETKKIPLIMSSNDSIYIDYQYKNITPKYSILGSRLAENLNEQRGIQTIPEYFLNEKKSLEKPEKFISKFEKTYNKNVKSFSQFRTADNFRVRDDYIDKEKKLMNIKFLDSWNSYVENRKESLGKETETIPLVQEMQKSLDENDASLLSVPEYARYVKTKLISKDTSAIAPAQKYYNALTQLPDSEFKNRALSIQLKEDIQNTSDSASRNALMKKYLPQITNPIYKNSVLQYDKDLNEGIKGQKAVDFEAINLEGSEVSLSKFKGKYVILDLWATWCVPCTKQAPFFEKYADFYKRFDQIQFISLSIDENKNDWIAKTKNDESPVLQLYLINPDKFIKSIDLQSIPRFVLIGPDGKYIDADLPFPSNYEFEEELKKNIKLETNNVIIF